LKTAAVALPSGFNIILHQTAVGILEAAVVSKVSSNEIFHYVTEFSQQRNFFENSQSIGFLIDLSHESWPWKTVVHNETKKADLSQLPPPNVPSKKK
jgi:hypothetical protein